MAEKTAGTGVCAAGCGVAVREYEKGKKDRGFRDDHENWRSTNIGADLAAVGLVDGSTEP
jgi:hypothetical protein